MTPKDYLDKCRRLELNVREAQNEYEMLYATMLSAVQHKQDPVTSSPKSPVEDKYLELADRSSDVNRAIDAKVDHTLKVSAELDQMKDDKLRCLLRDRYICCKSWEQIAVDMGYVIRRVYQLHGEALQEFEKLYPEKFTQAVPLSLS